MAGRRRLGLGLGLGFGAVLAVAGLGGLSGSSVEGAFTEALRSRAIEPGALDMTRTAGAADGGFWLSKADATDVIAPFTGPMAVGDRITVKSGDGRERILEVVDVRALHAPVSRASDAATFGLHVVTCAIVGQPEARPVRFIVEAETPDASVPQGKAKAL
jgi:hypothetical protein